MNNWKKLITKTSITAAILTLGLSNIATPAHASERCIRFGGNIYDVCIDGNKVTGGLARGKKFDARVFGGYYDHPKLVVVFAKPQESPNCNSSQTYFMELIGPNNASGRVKLVRWTNMCGETRIDGTVYDRAR